MIIKVATVLILNFRYDFFLVSQSVRQGTVSPTHYNIVHDTLQIKPDYMQRLTYKLTHLYYNWPVSRIVVLLYIDNCIITIAS